MAAAITDMRLGPLQQQQQQQPQQPPHVRRLGAVGRHLPPRRPGRALAAAESAGAFTEGLAAEVDELFEAYFAEGGGPAPGVSYGVVVGGKLVHTGGHGTLRVGEDVPPGPDSIFRIASMSKSFVAATVLLLRDEGVLRLDDLVERWVPQLKGLPLATADSPKPTLRHLLSMNGGLPEDDPWADRLESLTDDEYSLLIGRPKTVGRPAGVAFEYSNLGFTLLGRVIQEATGRNTLEYISEKIIEPLGMKDTAWSEEHLDKKRVAAGYAKADRGSGKGEKTSGEGGGGEWVAQPIQEPGTFSALGGIYSTVTDLAIWVQGFIDAWPARDGADRHPLCRASRREMQQVHTVMPLMLGAAGESGASRPLSAGYCFGLSSAETLKAGRIIGHSGGYPGFGSNMSWSASAKVGVIGLANGRYGGPYSQVSDTVAKLAQALPAKLSVQPVHAAIAIRAAIDGALNAGRDRGLMELKPLLSANVDQDQPLAVRAKLFDSMVGLHGALTPEPGFAIVGSPTTLGWWLAAANGGRVGVGIMINPEGEVQTLSLTSVRPPTDELKAVLAAAVAAVESGDHEFSGLLLPLQAPPSWTDCDGESTGVALLEGAHIRVAVALEVGAEPVFSPLAEAALPA